MLNISKPIGERKVNSCFVPIEFNYEV
jgi:hypothetical protein